MIQSLFTNHPASVGETYLQHAAFAGRFAFRLFLASCAAVIHAVIPCLFEKTASRMIAEMYEMTRSRG